MQFLFLFSLCARACVCLRVPACACAAQTASSAHAPWKTSSVSVDGVSRQRSSSDPPAVHPPLPPLRVTSTSTSFPLSSLPGALQIWTARVGRARQVSEAAWGAVASPCPRPAPPHPVCQGLPAPPPPQGLACVSSVSLSPPATFLSSFPT